ncbi:MAG: NADH:ubiquinone reductase (Na(+)-transporting) subunit D, partial [Clostridiaceae bacterium]|nr:NADH:ubiquinone reductase (Na(+)-transporting) subunit D [Clostridiaceae bacterium]
LGFGTIFGYNINWLGMDNWTIMVMAPSAFFIIGVLIWIVSNRQEKKKGR